MEDRPRLIDGALLLLFVNGFNLLPILPLDGGHVLQDLLFCRNRWLDVAFRILAIIGLVALGIFGGMKLLMYVSIPLAMALPVIFKLSKVTDQVRLQALKTYVDMRSNDADAVAKVLDAGRYNQSAEVRAESSTRLEIFDQRLHVQAANVEP